MRYKRKNIDITNINYISRINHNKEIRTILLKDYGIRIKTIRIPNNKSFVGNTFYLPFCVSERNDEDRNPIATLFWNKKVYITLDGILDEAKKGTLNLELI